MTEPQPAAPSIRPMRALIGASLALAIALSALSAYLRLIPAEPSCAPWPQCQTELEVAAQSHAPLAGTAHTVLAGTLGLLVIALNGLAWHRRTGTATRGVAAVVLALVVGLAVLGIWSGRGAPGGVVAANITGGLGLIAGLAVLWRTAGRMTAPRRTIPSADAALIAVLLTITIVTGAVMAADPSNGAPGAAAPVHSAIHPLSAAITLAVMALLAGRALRARRHRLRRYPLALTVMGAALALPGAGPGLIAGLVHHLATMMVLTGAALTPPADRGSP